MSKILLMEPDAVFAAVLEDHLRVAGHHVTVVPGLEGLTAEGSADPADMVILDGDAASTLAAVGQLRADHRTLGLPVLVLAPDQERDARLTALRAGADEHLGRPLDLEETMLRIERLLGRRAPAPQLSGDLAGHPLPDLLQYVQQTGKSGRLRVSGIRDRGEAVFRQGQLIEATWGNLPGQEAALAMIGQQHGSFRFESDRPGQPRQTDHGGMPLQRLLLQCMWLADELAARRASLPATGAVLEALVERLPPLDPAFDSLPIERAFARIKEGSGVRIYDLIADEVEAPTATRLAVAWLAEQGAVAPAGTSAEAPPPTTGEISSSMLFQINLTVFLGAAKKAGLSADPLPLLIVASSGSRARVIQMVQGVQGYLQNEALRTLAERLTAARSASSVFASDEGRLSLHVQLLDDEETSLLESVVPVCGGVLLWLAGDEQLTAAHPIVDRLQASRTRARGIVVAADPTGRAAAEALIADHDRWQLTPHEPKSLLGVLRLLEPKA